MKRLEADFIAVFAHRCTWTFDTHRNRGSIIPLSTALILRRTINWPRDDWAINRTRRISLPLMPFWIPRPNWSHDVLCGHTRWHLEEKFRIEKTKVEWSIPGGCPLIWYADDNAIQSDCGVLWVSGSTLHLECRSAIIGAVKEEHCINCQL